MKHTTIHALIALFTGAIATAQPPQGRPQGPEGNRPPPPLVGALDTDHDRTISAEEIAAAATALATLDKNGDGQLTREEMRPPRPEGKGPQGPRPEGKGPKGPRPAEGGNAGRPPRPQGGNRPDGPPPGQGEAPEGRPGPPPIPPIIVVLDSDKDGTISAAEISAAPESLANLDKNADGQLTVDEFAPRPPRGKGPRPPAGKP